MENTIKEIFRKNNITEYGFCKIEDGPFTGLKYAVSFCVPLPKSVIKEIKNGPTKIYFHHYRTINAYIDRVSLEICLLMRNSGFDAAYIPASQSTSEDGFKGDFPHKKAAVLAGLGGIGLSDLFVSSAFGPAVRLGTVFVSAPLKTTETSKNPCLKCGKCVRNCPSGALKGVSFEEAKDVTDIIDVSLCSHYMKKSYQNIGRGSVCGICMAVCPLCYKEE